MTKITSEHLSRCAIVYVRQSTFYQVMNNLESGRRQYGLVERARQLGWSDVQVIDEDLGRSGSGTTRVGFEKLLTAVCERNVGAVLSLEASRLGRNGRDWHTLLEFCGLVGALIVDEDGVYDPRLPNDRLLLGMKGTMSEMEVSVFRQRSIEAIRQKARRGEYFSTVGVGYVKCEGDRIEKAPDRRVQEAMSLIFRKFAELQTVRRWNERLVAVRTLEEDIGRLVTDHKPVLTSSDRDRLLLRGEDLARGWNNPEVTNETRKKIVRLLIKKIVVDTSDNTIDLIVHWQGGDHTRLTTKKNRAGQTRWSTDDDVIDLIEALARQMPDEAIAAVLNRSRKQTGRGNTWTRMRVCSVRNQRGISPYQEGERKTRGEVTLNEAADILIVSPSTVLRMIGTGLLSAHQLCKGAPWIIRESALHTEPVQHEAKCRRARVPSSHDPRQQPLNL
jgi:DNA invertase Pin-like site-specific DNA recombinase